MRRLLAFLVLLACLHTGQAVPARGDESFKIVVDAANPVSSLSKTEASRLFLKKRSRWDHGIRVFPVDQLPAGSVRQAFSRQVHGRSVDAVKGYWQAQLFSGNATPPPEVASDADVLDYVRSHDGAIGYVTGSARITEGVKVLTLTE